MDLHAEAVVKGRNIFFVSGWMTGRPTLHFGLLALAEAFPALATLPRWENALTMYDQHALVSKDRWNSGSERSFP